MADKPAVLAFLRAHSESWLSTAQIKSEVGSVPERTLRNWLTSLIEEGAIESRGEP